jgi:formate/nitrite transporter FocA (FNT family)
MSAGMVPDNIVQAAKDAFTEGTKWSALAAGIFLALGFIATFRLSSRKHGEPISK